MVRRLYTIYDAIPSHRKGRPNFVPDRRLYFEIVIEIENFAEAKKVHCGSYLQILAVHLQFAEKQTTFKHFVASA